MKYREPFRKARQIRKKVCVESFSARVDELVRTRAVFRELDVVSAEDMSKCLGVHVSTLHRWVAAGKIVGHFAGNRKLYFLRSDFEPEMTTIGGFMYSRDIANVFGLSVSRVQRWLREGRLPGRKLGRRWAVTLEDLQHFMDGGLMDNE